MRNRSARILVIITAIYWLALFGATHIPATRLPRTHINDKIEHFAAYAILAALLFATLRHRDRTQPALSIAIRIVIVCMIYGAIDEVTQPLPFIRRICSFNDWLADVTGAILAVSTGLIAARIARR